MDGWREVEFIPEPYFYPMSGCTWNLVLHLGNEAMDIFNGNGMKTTLWKHETTIKPICFKTFDEMAFSPLLLDSNIDASMMS